MTWGLGTGKWGLGTGDWGLGVLCVAALLGGSPASGQSARTAPAVTPNAQQQPAQTLDLTAVSLPIPAAGKLVAITNATIMTASNGTIEKGTIVIRDGKIAAVGADVPVPAGAKIAGAASSSRTRR